MTHLADSDGTNQITVDRAVTIFNKAVEAAEKQLGPLPVKHIGQTAGSLRVANANANAVRIGIGLHGVNPLSADYHIYNVLAELMPVATVFSTITAIQTVNAGEGVGYNYTFTAK